MPREICGDIDKGPGDLVHVELWKDDAPRTVEIPEAFVELLQREELMDAFERLSLTRRKEYRNWIETAKREETRERRMAKAIAWLRAESPQELS